MNSSIITNTTVCDKKAQAESVQSMLHTLEHKHELGRGSSLNEGTRDKGGKWGM